MIKPSTAIENELADREAIRDALMRYCRGIDRFDEDLIRSAYWPDAHDNHLDFSGTVEEFIVYAKPIMQAMRYSQHLLGNILIAIDGDTAEVESYFQGYHSLPNESGDRADVVAGGRYLDVFEKRIDEWRILKRFVMTDWYRTTPTEKHWQPFGNPDVVRGEQKPADKSYTFFSLL